MTHRTAREARDENIKKMGRDLGEQFSALWQEVAQLHQNWGAHLTLFGHSEERVDFLNRAAPRFFYGLQEDGWAATLLHLSRLTDPTSSSGNKARANLTIESLPWLVNDARLEGRVRKLVKTAKKATEFSRDWRNRRIAHRDLNLALDRAVTPLAPASIAQVNDALSAIAAVLKAIEEHYSNTETAFDFIMDDNDGDRLLALLEDGMAARG